MTQIRVAVEIDSPPSDVWADLADIASHVEWMHDAVAIHFTSETTSGTGTTFDCHTKVGPFRLVDRMEVTSWLPEREMGVVHRGTVTGQGVFSLVPVGAHRTRFEWRETLRFPWWMGGPIAATIGRPLLTWIWRRNLRRLAARFRDQPPRSQP